MTFQISFPKYKENNAMEIFTLESLADSFYDHYSKTIILLRSATLGARIAGDSTDLISLAEKGKVNGGSSASSTSSNGSADDDPNHHQHNTQQGSVIRHPQPPPSSSSSASVIRTGVGGDSSRNSNNDTTTNTPQAHCSSSVPPQHHHSASSSQLLISSSSASHPHSSAVVSTSLSMHHQQALAIASTSSNFRRMMMPPRTKSLDSESPPPSEQGLSTYGDSIADQDDHIFEVEEISLVEGDLGMVGDSSRVTCPTSPVQCGNVEVGFDYDAAARKMTVHIIQVRGVPPKDIGGANNTQVRVVLLPGRKQKHKTKVRPGENPSFMETFVFTKINPEDVSSLGVRFRLYGCERMRRERLLGECVLEFGSLHLELETTIWLNLEPRYHLSWDSRSETGSLARSDSASSTASIQSGIPELLVGLAYNGTTGRLTCEIIKGSHFRQLAGGRAPDSYIKLVLVNTNGQEMGRAKTSLRRAQSNPLFKETFMFQVALFQIQEVTLLVSVYGRKGVTRRELLGWFALGYNSSGDEESTHWEDMVDALGDQMCRWHVLQT
ncbi:Synaptotagmin-16 [Orchesella cincta]|uniref:Synaptotagmin-16 n=1 Tax=Orchesella cincta TaxID=48709 RepID=A0A1D2NN05_ORCCI|nr:Synaptotagmin-16 [Orchesella cincta]